jgi:hypothetical protein
MTDAGPITLAFLGHGDDAATARAGQYEDAVLALLPDHGARVLYRGRRAQGQPEVLPLEVHLLWFPDRAAFDAYLGDPRRAALLAEFGDVFTAKHVVELDTLAP